MTRTIVLLAIIAWQSTGEFSRSDDAPAGRPSLSGKVIDEARKPLAGVRIDISTADPKVGRGILSPSCYLDCSKWTSTDMDGEFVLKELDATLKFRLVIAMPGRKTVQSELIDPQQGPVSFTLSPLPDDIDPGRVVSGIVTMQGVPVAGALVKPHGAKTSGRRWYGQVKGVDATVTDNAGRFAMSIPDDFLALDIEVTGHGFCGIQVQMLLPGLEPFIIDVATGVRVTGKLLHRGQPVGGMSIAVVQTNRSSTNGIFIAAVGDVTAADGSFEFRNLPADQQYCIFSVVGDAKRSQSEHILTSKKFNVPASGETRDLGELEVSSPIAIRGRVERVDAKPLPANLKLSFGREPAWDVVSVPVASDGTFEAVGLVPETYEIRVASRELIVVPDGIKYQMLGESSFGVHAQESLKDLVIPVKGK